MSGKIRGPLSRAIDKAIREYAGQYSDLEIASALNESAIFKERGLTITPENVQVRLGRVRKRVGEENDPRPVDVLTLKGNAEKPPLVITLTLDESSATPQENFWSEECIELLKQKYAESKKYARLSKELKTLWDELEQGLSNLGKSNVTRGMVKAVAIDHKLGSWGVSLEEQEKADKEAITAVFARIGNYKSKDEFVVDLMKKVPLNRITTTKGILYRVAQLGFDIPKFESQPHPLTGFKRFVTEKVEAIMNAPELPESIKVLKRMVKDALPEHLQNSNEEVTGQMLFEVLYTYYFKFEKREQLLLSALKAGIGTEKVLADLKRSRTRVPPLWVLEAKFEEMKGRTHAPRKKTKQAIRGILRIPFADAKERTVPSTSYAKPFHALYENEGTHFNFGLISAPKIGLPYHVDIWSNLLRCALATARKQKLDALVIGGGLFEITLKKASGHHRILTDLILAGKDFDPEVVAECYKPEARRIKEEGSLEPIFVTAAENFAEKLRGWFKVSMRPSGKPEYTGLVLVVLSSDDLTIIRKITAAELTYQQQVINRQAKAKADYYTKLLLKAEEEGLTDDEIESIETERDRAEDLYARSRLSNLDETQNARVYNRALSYFVSKIEENIPHAVVVDQNSALVKFGKSAHVFNFVCASERNAFKHAVSNWGSIQREGILPDMTVLMNSASAYYKKTTRANFKDGKMTGDAAFVEAPVLIDHEPILERTHGVRVPLAAAKTVSDSMYNGGMLILSTHPELGVHSKMLTSEMVREVGRSRHIRTPSKVLWIMESSDWHVGGGMRYRIYRPDGSVTYVSEATLEMLKRSGINKNGAACVHMYVVADDLMNGNHFGTERSPHYNEQSIARVMQWMQKRKKEAESIRTVRELREFENETSRLLMSQLSVRVPHSITTQMRELVDGIINPHHPVFKAIILRAKQSHVNVRGISAITGLPDTRDVGVINFGSGNHAGKTTDYMYHEGPDVADKLRQRLWDDPDLKGLDMEKLICAPVHQRESTGYGTVSVDNKFTYGLHIAATPPKRTSWYDLVEGWIKVNRQRGNPSTILNNMPIVHITGDKHFFAVSYAGGDLYVMGPSATHTDEFADMAGGLPENNTGVAFIGLPVDGLDHGAIDVIHLKASEIQEYMSHPERAVPWGDICPNPA